MSNVKEKFSGLARKTVGQDSDKNQEWGGLIKKNRMAGEMKKKYRAMIDYETKRVRGKKVQKLKSKLKGGKICLQMS